MRSTQTGEPWKSTDHAGSLSQSTNPPSLAVCPRTYRSENTDQRERGAHVDAGTAVPGACGLEPPMAHACRVITGTGVLEERKAPIVLCWKMPGFGSRAALPSYAPSPIVLFYASSGQPSPLSVLRGRAGVACRAISHGSLAALEFCLRVCVSSL